MSIEKIKEILKDGLVERPEPLIGAKTVQLVFFRQALDFTVLRTEESREINHAVTPRSMSDGTSIRRVAFLASKQKAAESRRLQSLVPLTLFPSIVTLRSVTATEVALSLKAILATTSYGAESRTSGDMRNLLAGVVVGWEEIVTPLELALELSNGDVTVAAVAGVLGQ